MPSYEHFHQEQFFTFDPASTLAESYHQTNMDYHYNADAYQNNYTFNFADVASAHTESMDHFKYEMSRTASNASGPQQSHEFPSPTFLSDPTGSASTSTVGSPFSEPSNTMQPQDYSEVNPAIFMTTTDYYPYQQDFPCDDSKYLSQSLDPNMLYQQPITAAYPQIQYNYVSPSTPSPVPSHHSYSNYSQPAKTERCPSVLSHTTTVASPRTSLSGDEDGEEKGRCPHSDCGRVVKDLKAHMLTHQARRPEKCPIVNCDYHTKGFARKYDRNRHVLTHYKGTMVCGFCPGSGSPQEKTFNRADVFKRHLTTMHNVEQSPPNKKRSPSTSNKKLSSYCQDATGKCSTCSATFNNAQEFYDHLDECVLNVVQQVEKSEAINELRLNEVPASDPAVKETFDRNHIKPEELPQYSFDDEDEDEDEEEDDDEEDNEDANSTFKSSKLSGNRVVIGGRIGKPKKKGGMTWSKIGVGAPAAGKGRKRRKNYPPSWGMSADKMKMKKRVLCIYDGSRRLLKDDMMLQNDFEVRLKLGETDRYVTDLDIVTMERAQAYHNATAEEKGPWMPEQEFNF